MIPFKLPVVGTELDYMQSAMGSGKLCGDGGFTRRCQQWLEQRFGSAKVLPTPSCTASLEMAALLLDIQPGDEVIMPELHLCLHRQCLCAAWRENRLCGCVRPDTMKHQRNAD